MVTDTAHVHRIIDPGPVNFGPGNGHCKQHGRLRPARVASESSVFRMSNDSCYCMRGHISHYLRAN